MSGPQHEPCVGIFWGICDAGSPCTIVHALASLGEAEPYGDCLTYSGAHYTVWEAWRRLRHAGLRAQGLPPIIASYEYEHFPRGRVVYMRPDNIFTIFADRRLQRVDLIDQIVEIFGLADHCHVVRSDLHYRS
ncbi:hypothetical protein [Methylobacterium sp. WL7]|uniref:hypothetical protein n=1 Tax=Methylobacterium sp. WL7 TaxID=2603900 RepID=UPI0011C8124B|nr:hypothetical protein [Methylobacterium sp. WL7]TXN41741.1 hypothetical protein FV233_24775 [Methylobacterium sp. WL7]